LLRSETKKITGGNVLLDRVQRPRNDHSIASFPLRSKRVCCRFDTRTSHKTYFVFG